MSESELADAREYVEGRLDAPYVASTAAAVADALARRVPMEVCFQPGDGTRYDLVFTPVLALESAPPRVASMRCHECRGSGQKILQVAGGDNISPCRECGGSGRTPPQEWDRLCSFGVSREPFKAVVAWTDHGAFGADLACGGFQGDYIAEIFGTTVGSGLALAHLFNLTAEAVERGALRS